MHFQPKKHFSAKRKNGRFFVILAGTWSVVILSHFLDGPDGPTKFLWQRSKTKGTYKSEVGMAGNRTYLLFIHTMYLNVRILYSSYIYRLQFTWLQTNIYLYLGISFRPAVQRSWKDCCDLAFNLPKVQSTAFEEQTVSQICHWGREAIASDSLEWEQWLMRSPGVKALNRDLAEWFCSWQFLSECSRCPLNISCLCPPHIIFILLSRNQES